MKKRYAILFLAVAIIIIVFFVIEKSPTNNDTILLTQIEKNEIQNPLMQNSQDIQNNKSTSSFQPPLDKANERVTKKPFGIYITSKNSPIQPERFHGYHTGTDFEIFPEELNTDVAVRAVCAGKIILKKYAGGYGGVAVESCRLDGNPIAVIYGHLNLASIIQKEGDSLNVGDTIGNLGAAYSTQTSGERKHLHLGFHKGDAINILGYVNSQSQLSDWIDPCPYVCK